ncbi:MAG: SUF system NifU family Fe-S cluster assembly protein [Candidatus Omnitrophica bacterium CG11_big_fil_rev_8_21_14_0_20_64_10]|nr:MAG: SUF system NifU family Fe-S cluster assembly protein [Candidatus Omnitrophica bacterium CG11_big_fil_rev_8_21_14_0_20_64_10]
MSLTDDLYREVILEHFKNPRHPGRLEKPDLMAQGANPFCGDEMTLTLSVKAGRIEAIRAECAGCSISQAAASMMTEAVTGRSFEEAVQIAKKFKGMMLEGGTADFPDDLEDLEALEGVKKYPVRIKCAILSWNTLLEAIAAWKAGKHEASHTEGEEGDRPDLAHKKPEETEDPPAPTVPAAGAAAVPSDAAGAVREKLKGVIDPEINMNVVDLGLIYDVQVADKGQVRVVYTLTSPGCPLGPLIKGQIEGAVTKLPWVQQIHSELVWSPPWDPRTMASEEAKDTLGIW